MFMPQVFNLALYVAGVLRKETILLSLCICFPVSDLNICALDIGFDLQNGREQRVKEAYSVQFIM